MKKKILLLLPLLFSLASCNPGVGPTGPAGQDGVDGVDGQDGHSPELTIGTNGNWYIDGEDTGIKATGADGEDGKDGLDGQDGDTPRIGANGNWWIGNVDTGIKAEGQDGEDGKTPEITIGDEGNWYIDGEDTGKSAIGTDGLAPHIGENGNWWIGDEDTNIPARGQDGEDGKTPNIIIGDNGNWWIDGVDTGRPASVTTAYVVSLDPNGGQLPEGAIQSYQVYSGSCISSLPVPTRNNYEFLGWYTGMEETDGLFTTTTPVQSDLNLVARWQSLAEETYTVTWVNYNGSVLERDYGVGRGDYPSYDGETPTRPYGSDGKQYTFSGWSPSLSYVYEDITYVAQYTESLRRLTVTFDVGEYGSIASESQVVEWGKGVSKPEIDISSVPGNVVFTGWYEDVDLTEQVVFPYVPTSDITLHAGWEVVEDVSDRLTFYYDSSYDGYVVRSYNETDAVRTVVIPDTWNDGINGVKNVVGIQGAFSSNRNVETVVLPSSLKFIGEYAFSNSSVRNINYPDTLESIGQYAFNNAPIVDGDLSNTKLTEISQYSFYATNIGALSLPESVISIGSYAFSSCSNLTEVTFNDGLQSIGQYAFYRSSIVNGDLSNTKLTEISQYSFYGTNIGALSLPESVISIGSYAFSSCSNLTEVTFNDGLQSIGSCAFYHCVYLTKVTFNEGLQSIDSYAFGSCHRLAEATFNDGLQSIGQYAFSGCYSLIVTFNEGLQSIGDYAFESCYSLTTVIIPETVTTIGFDAFYGCSRLTIYCKANALPSGWLPSWNGDRPIYWYSEEDPSSTPGNYWHYNEEGKPWKW